MTPKHKFGTHIRAFLLKLRRLSPPSEDGDTQETGFREHPNGRDGTCHHQQES